MFSPILSFMTSEEKILRLKETFEYYFNFCFFKVTIKNFKTEELNVRIVDNNVIKHSFMVSHLDYPGIQKLSFFSKKNLIWLFRLLNIIAQS